MLRRWWWLILLLLAAAAAVLVWWYFGKQATGRISKISKGDLSSLTPQQRSDYYLQVCQSCGLNPLTKPFDYLTLNGKLVLYPDAGHAFLFQYAEDFAAEVNRFLS